MFIYSERVIQSAEDAGLVKSTSLVLVTVIFKPRCVENDLLKFAPGKRHALVVRVRKVPHDAGSVRTHANSSCASATGTVRAGYRSVAVLHVDVVVFGVGVSRLHALDAEQIIRGLVYFKGIRSLFYFHLIFYFQVV